MQKAHLKNPKTIINNNHCKDLTNMPLIVNTVFIYDLPIPKNRFTDSEIQF